MDEDGKITDARFKTFGCGSAIASSSLATEWVKGKSVSRRLLMSPGLCNNHNALLRNLGLQMYMQLLDKLKFIKVLL